MILNNCAVTSSQKKENAEITVTEQNGVVSFDTDFIGRGIIHFSVKDAKTNESLWQVR